MNFKKIERKAQKRVRRFRAEQVKKEQEAIFKDHSRDPDPYWHTVVLGVIAVLGVFATIVTSTVSGKIWGLSVFLCGVIAPLVLAVVLGWIRERFKAERRIPSPTPESLRPSNTIPPYLTNTVSELKEELLGKKSRYGRTRCELEEINQRARKALEQLELRCKQNDVEYLRQAKTRAEQVLQSTDSLLETLKVFKGKVEAFLAECHGAISGLDPALRDLELIREVNELHARTLELEIQAQDVITDTVTELQDRMLGVKSDVFTRFGHSGIRLSIENPDGEPLHSLALLEDRVAGFAPEKTIE